MQLFLFTKPPREHWFQLSVRREYATAFSLHGTTSQADKLRGIFPKSADLGILKVAGDFGNIWVVS